MYLWGRFDSRKARFIDGFLEIHSRNHFYFDPNLNQPVCAIPNDNSFAKHTQGLKSAPIIAQLASLIESG